MRLVVIELFGIPLGGRVLVIQSRESSLCKVKGFGFET